MLKIQHTFVGLNFVSENDKNFSIKLTDKFIKKGYGCS